MAKVMRRICLLLTFFIGMHGTANAQDYLTRDILSRVKKIKVGPTIGSAFVIEVDNRQYVITAKHIVATVTGDQSDVEFFETKGSKKIAMRILRCQDPTDIAVLVPRVPLLPISPVNNDDATITFGQDVYFLGFPYGDDTLATQIEDVSVAFVRKATYSAQERGDGWLRIYLDGRNNVGFSGGPVLIYDLSKQGHPLKVIGVVSAYRNEPTEVMRVEPVEEKDITPEDRASNRIAKLATGKSARLIGTGNVVLNNSGIVHAYGLRPAIDLIRISGGPGPEVK